MTIMESKCCRMCKLSFRSFRLLRIHSKSHHHHIYSCQHCQHGFTSYNRYYIHQMLQQFKCGNRDNLSRRLSTCVSNSIRSKIVVRGDDEDDIFAGHGRVMETLKDDMKQQYDGKMVPKSGDKQKNENVVHFERVSLDTEDVCHDRGHRAYVHLVRQRLSQLTCDMRRKQGHPEKHDFSKNDLLIQYRSVYRQNYSKEGKADDISSRNIATGSTTTLMKVKKILPEILVKYNCLECSKVFISKDLLQEHINRSHNNIRQYRCVMCDEVLNTCVKFKEHCRAHGITHPFQCVECGKTYTNENAMKVHYRTHLNSRPYKCLHCGCTFSQSSTLSNHLQRHSGETPFTCDICKKKFATKGDLCTHNRIHQVEKQLSCSLCGLKFPRKSNLTRHMRKHTGEKPFACEFCQKRFARSENCIAHQRTHTLERPYTCKQCGASFSDSGNFSKHKKLHSEGKSTRRRSPIVKKCALKKSIWSTDMTTADAAGPPRNFCTLHSSDELKCSGSKHDQRCTNHSIEPLCINRVRSQSVFIEKCKSSALEESPVNLACLSMTADIDKFRYFEETKSAFSAVNVRRNELISKPGNNQSSGENDAKLVGIDLITPIPDLSLSSNHSPNGSQPFLMADRFPCELNLPFLNDTIFVSNSPYSPYSRALIDNSYDSLISHSDHTISTNEFCLHGSLLSEESLPLRSTNQILPETTMQDSSDAVSHNTMSDKFTLDSNKLFSDDYLK